MSLNVLGVRDSLIFLKGLLFGCNPGLALDYCQIIA